MRAEYAFPRNPAADRSSMARAVARFVLIFLCILPGPAVSAEPQEIVCVRCHGSQEGKLGEPVALWRKSIHAANGVGCNDCHGGDPKGADAESAMSPARGFLGAPGETDVPKFCGKCHVGVLNDYLASAHGQALGSGGPTCVTCHGNHAVQKASLELINEKSCTRCHGFERARIIREAMRQTEGLILSIDARTTEAKGEGVDVDRLEKGLFSLRNRFHTLFHDVDVGKVREESSRINAELSKLDAALLEYAETRRNRRIAGAFAVAGALFAALLLHLLRKTYE